MSNDQQKKILVIEDDSFLSDLITRKFSAAGYAVFVAATGEEGIEQALAERPALILLDLVLPGVSGFDVLRKLRHSDATANTSILIASNLSFRDAKKQMPEIESVPYIVKAESTPQKILEAVEACLRTGSSPAAA